MFVIQSVRHSTGIIVIKFFNRSCLLLRSSPAHSMGLATHNLSFLGNHKSLHLQEGQAGWTDALHPHCHSGCDSGTALNLGTGAIEGWVSHDPISHLCLPREKYRFRLLSAGTSRECLLECGIESPAHPILDSLQGTKVEYFTYR